ncbi:hypothetical protein HMPREF0293_0961 [Corynebacterium glucuronolyticum ATCC 51866]|uniref:Uncharacterized protein n=1 Tax=Corynebacterium glucuronolyticum ATCC 51866 TaxID=548478 RepID=A0ABM9XQX9_9CORY|nr:hypothetical protein HMPREF0293_0961 [Corynebacterium glucuronolyticum ATCC 51866]
MRASADVFELNGRTIAEAVTYVSVLVPVLKVGAAGVIAGGD